MTLNLMTQRRGVDDLWAIHRIPPQTTSSVVLMGMGWARESRTGDVS